jgi:D-arabinose 1-dehydrogenase-like Zn-dependent alcohol dehydrogenase
VVERPLPEPASGQVRVKIEACGICHSDAFVKDGAFPGVEYPRVPGHEVIGRVDALGFSAGQRVGVGRHCFRCEACRSGDFVNCNNAQIAGVSYDGGYAESVGAPTLLSAGITSFNALRNAGARAGDPAAALQAIGGARVILGRRSIGGWPTGMPKDSEDTLDFSSCFDVLPHIETYPLEQAAEAYDRMLGNQARFRVVLTMGD